MMTREQRIAQMFRNTKRLLGNLRESVGSLSGTVRQVNAVTGTLEVLDQGVQDLWELVKDQMGGEPSWYEKFTEDPPLNDGPPPSTILPGS